MICLSSSLCYVIETDGTDRCSIESTHRETDLLFSSCARHLQQICSSLPSVLHGQGERRGEERKGFGEIEDRYSDFHLSEIYLKICLEKKRREEKRRLGNYAEKEMSSECSRLCPWMEED